MIPITITTKLQTSKRYRKEGSLNIPHIAHVVTQGTNLHYMPDHPLLWYTLQTPAQIRAKNIRPNTISIFIVNSYLELKLSLVKL